MIVVGEKMVEEYIKKIKINNMDRLAEYRKKLYEKPILKDLFLEVTLRCNARCEHCGSSCGDKIQTDEISADDLKKALKDIADKYDASQILLNVTGGEPLLQTKFLINLFKRLKQENIHTTIDTSRNV